MFMMSSLETLNILRTFASPVSENFPLPRTNEKNNWIDLERSIMSNHAIVWCGIVRQSELSFGHNVKVSNTIYITRFKTYTGTHYKMVV